MTPGAAQTPYVQDADFTLYVGDVREVLKTLPDESVQCVVTSPPYWGLRDYGTEGQLGLEPTPEAYVAAMTDVFREVRRVLRKDGTCWLNIGDSYAANRSYQVSDSKHQAHDFAASNAMSVPAGLKPKDLCGIPWRLAFALQADGWYLRSEIIWAKPNSMPESVTDRPTKSHEQVFLLARSPKYFFDQEAVREPWQGVPGLLGGAYSPPGQSPHGNARGPDGRAKTSVLGQNGSIQHRDGERWPNGGRNLRSVWEIPTQPFAEAHFATYPQALVERCIRAGTSEYGCCPVCGAPWMRETSTEYDAKGRTTNGPRSTERRHETAGFSQRLEKRVETTGWRCTCDCEDWARALPTSCVVLDPFLGSGTTALVARRLGRHSVGIELNEQYAEMAARRLGQQSLLAELAS